jgi:hypothetical protein
MLRAKSWQKSLSLCGLSLMLVVVTLSISEPGSTKPAQKNNQEEGLPGRRVGGGSRRCSIDGVNQPCPPILALVPSESLILAATDTPTLFLKFPKTDEQKVVQVELVVRDGSDRLVYEEIFILKDSGQIEGFEIGKNATFSGLVTGERYHWYLSVIHNPRDRAHDEVVEGWIRYQPLAPASSHRLNLAPPLEQAAIYEAEQRWPEAIETLIALQEQEGQNPQVRRAWEDLLARLDLAL